MTPIGRRVYATLLFVCAGGTRTEQFSWEEWRETPATHVRRLVLPLGHMAEVWPESAIAELLTWSAWLAGHYLWQETDAFWYLLTGSYPPVEPVRVESTVRGASDVSDGPITMIDGQITVTAAAWVSDKTFTQAFRAAQRAMLGKDNRPLQAKSLALARFIADWRRQHGGARGRWEPMMAAWNQTWTQHEPTWAYGRVTQFARDVDRAKDAVLLPAYHASREEVGTGIAWGASGQARGPTSPPQGE